MNNPDLIRAYTPLVLGIIGGVTGTIVAVCAMLSPALSTDKFWGAISFATGTLGLFGGASAGAAMPGSRQPSIGDARGSRINIEQSYDTTASEEEPYK